MYRVIGLLTLAFAWGTLFFPLESLQATRLSDSVGETLRKRIAISPEPLKIVCRAELLCGSAVLPRFYKHRAFQPAWITEHGPQPQATILINAIHEANREGLRPQDYHLAAIEALLEQTRHSVVTGRSVEPDKLVDLDLLLTDAFLLYGSHLLTGHVDPETIQAEWFIKRREADLVELLESALQENRIAVALEDVRPQSPGYARLKQVLLDYQDIMKSGGWPRVPSGPIIQKGFSGVNVAALRSRLIASLDLDESAEGDHYVFDEVLERAVQRFQKRHGLKADGIVGPATLAVLNVPVEDRVRQIKVNMERWRWLPRDFGGRYILVNIADFECEVIEEDQIAMTMRAVVGTRYRRTPVFTGRMTYMKFNPYWNIPPGIAREDILPFIREDPQYLVKEKIRIFQGWDANAPELDPESIDWSQITEKNFTFKLRQDPGPSNSLGRAKFMFPNKFDVYLHDTPGRWLFNETKRSFSSGCIRIEKPIELAEYLLGGDVEWNRDKILAAINSSKTQIVWIPKPIAIHILYWTAWVDGDGTIHFRDDIYERDSPVDEALNVRPPRP